MKIILLSLLITLISCQKSAQVHSQSRSNMEGDALVESKATGPVEDRGFECEISNKESESQYFFLKGLITADRVLTLHGIEGKKYTRRLLFAEATLPTFKIESEWGGTYKAEGTFDDGHSIIDGHRVLQIKYKLWLKRKGGKGAIERAYVFHRGIRSKLARYRHFADIECKDAIFLERP